MRRSTAKRHKKSVRSDWQQAESIDPDKLVPGFLKFAGDFDNRGQDRISQRELRLVSMSIRIPGNQEWVAVKLWDFTSISFGIIYEPEQQFVEWSSDNGKGGPERSGLPIQAGDEIEVRILVLADQEFTIWCEAKNVVPWKDGLKIGLRRLDVNFPQSVAIDRREADRLDLSLSLSLGARIKHPLLFGHWCALKVSDINRHLGLSFTSEDPSLLLFEGMEVQVHFELASLRNLPMTARVAWVHATKASSVKFGVMCLDMNWKLHNGICEFLLFSRQWTPARLRESGFKAQQVKSRLRFRTVKNMSDYAEILHLRRDAYVDAAKKPEGTSPESMAGHLDGMSRILMVHHHDKLVGTMTFTYPAGEDILLDSQAGFAGQKYPVDLPPKANLIEVSRLCIHRDYRGTDLLQGLFEHGIKHFLTSDRHWLLTSAVDDLLPTYLRIGFVQLGASYNHQSLNNRKHHLILAHRNAFLQGNGMNLLVWNALFGEVITHLLDRNLVSVPAPQRVLIRGKLLLRSLCKRFLENQAARAFKRHLLALRRLGSAAPAEAGSILPPYLQE